MPQELVRAGSVDGLRGAGRRVVTVGGRPVLVLWDGSAFRALDNRCPHMGFPLSKGDLADGLLDGHWHHARFDVSCGATLDPWADDAQGYEVVVRDGDVLVDPQVPRRDPREHGLARLARGLADDLRLVVAKAVVELDAGGVPPLAAVAAGARYGATEREDGCQPGLSVLAAMANVLPALEAPDRRRAARTSPRRCTQDGGESDPGQA